jgi:hypothetical protein
VKNVAHLENAEVADGFERCAIITKPNIKLDKSNTLKATGWNYEQMQYLWRRN